MADYGSECFVHFDQSCYVAQLMLSIAAQQKGITTLDMCQYISFHNHGMNENESYMRKAYRLGYNNLQELPIDNCLPTGIVSVAITCNVRRSRLGRVSKESTIL